MREALLVSARAEIVGAPTGTTNKTVYVGTDGMLDDIEVPPFFQYALTSGGNIEMKNGAVFIGIEPGGNAMRNANIFTNGNIVIDSWDNLVEGFGYHGGDMSASSSQVTQTFQPNYNPTGEAIHQQVGYVNVPLFQADQFQDLATQHTYSDLSLSGHYTLGTRDNPVIWYVEGNLKTNGATTISGYGVFLVKGNVEIEHDLSTDAGAEETTLGLYTSGNIEFKNGHLDVSAQLFANGNVIMEGHSTLYGNLTSDGNPEFKGRATIYYRPASPALTDPFWPTNSQ